MSGQQPVPVSGEDQPDPRLAVLEGHGFRRGGKLLAELDTADRAAGIRRVTRADECRSHAAALMGVVPELDDLEAAELVTARAMQWEAEAERPVAEPTEPPDAATQQVQEDRPTCEHGWTEPHWYPNPACEERWPECISCGYDPRCCRFPESCSADERCPGPAAESSASALVVQEDRP